jgi:hypothetical protein
MGWKNGVEPGWARAAIRSHINPRDKQRLQLLRNIARLRQVEALTNE